MADISSKVILWQDKANEHLMVAELLFSKDLFGTSCFHSHQVAETSFKALIVWRGKTPPRDHQLMILVRHSLDDYPQLSHLVNDALRLDPYDMDTPYFDEIGVMTYNGPRQAEAALDSAKRIRKAVLEITGG